MVSRPSDEKIVERYLEYLSSRKFNPVLKKLAGTPYGHVFVTFVSAMSGVGAPFAVYHGWKVLTHRKRRRREMIAVAKAARPIKTYPVMVNTLLTRTLGTIAPGLVIGSFKPRVAQDDEYWLDLMAKFAFLDPNSMETAEEKGAVAWMQDERYVESRRLRLPRSLTGGHDVYAFSVMLVGDHFRGGIVDGHDIHCMAVPGEVGAIQHMPWWIAEGQPAPALPASRRTTSPVDGVFMPSIDEAPAAS